MLVTYAPLEEKLITSLGLTAPSFSEAASGSISAVTSLAVILFFVAIAGAFFVRVLAGGIYRLKASEEGIRQSDEAWRKATYGVLGVFLMFLFFATFNSDFLLSDIGLSRLSVSPVSVGGETTTGERGGTVPTGSGGAPVTGSGSGWDAIKEDPAVRKMLRELPNGGVGVNNLVCGDPKQTGCTTVGGLPTETISMLKELRQVCSGNLEISGGTEAGHSSHGPGLYPVDITYRDSTVNNCIRGFTKSSIVPRKKTGAPLCKPGEVYERFGFVFCDEDSSSRHWHVFKRP